MANGHELLFEAPLVNTLGQHLDLGITTMWRVELNGSTLEYGPEEAICIAALMTRINRPLLPMDFLEWFGTMQIDQIGRFSDNPLFRTQDSTQIKPVIVRMLSRRTPLSGNLFHLGKRPNTVDVLIGNTQNTDYGERAFEDYYGSPETSNSRKCMRPEVIGSFRNEIMYRLSSASTEREVNVVPVTRDMPGDTSKPVVIRERNIDLPATVTEKFLGNRKQVKEPDPAEASESESKPVSSKVELPELTKELVFQTVKARMNKLEPGHQFTKAELVSGYVLGRSAYEQLLMAVNLLVQAGVIIEVDLDGKEIYQRTGIPLKGQK